MSTALIPLVVDLDGTLLRTDVLYEALSALIRRRPTMALWLPMWVCRGRAYFKQQVTAAADLAVEWLPYNQEVLDFIKREKNSGRRLVLASAADQRAAQAVAAYVGVFDEVLASDGKMNVSGRQKARILIERFGQKKFDYIGNSIRDVAVWRASRHALVANASSWAVAAARKAAPVTAVFPGAPLLPAFITAIRPHQWVKNLLLFVPLTMAHQLSNVPLFIQAAVAAAAFSLCASALYLLNDMLDVDADRRHETKRFRPLAAGSLPLPWAGAGFLVLVAVSFAIASVLPSTFLLLLLGYTMAVITYSVYLKEVVLIDVVVLASFYSLRVIAGAEAVTVTTSYWLLAFSLFFFLSLALVKRFAELEALPPDHNGQAHGRGYQRSDMVPLAGLGEGSGYLSVLVLALYINSGEVTNLYARPGLLWLLCPLLLYWISRVWLFAHRGRMPEDPIIFAFKDKISYIVGLLGALLIFLAV